MGASPTVSRLCTVLISTSIIFLQQLYWYIFLNFYALSMHISIYVEVKMRVGDQHCDLCDILAILFKLCVQTYLVQSVVVELAYTDIMCSSSVQTTTMYFLLCFTENGNTASSIILKTELRIHSIGSTAFAYVLQEKWNYVIRKCLVNILLNFFITFSKTITSFKITTSHRKRLQNITIT